jgi:hypothetical protein
MRGQTVSMLCYTIAIFLYLIYSLNDATGGRIFDHFGGEASFDLTESLFGTRGLRLFGSFPFSAGNFHGHFLFFTDSVGSHDPLTPPLGYGDLEYLDLDGVTNQASMASAMSAVYQHEGTLF